MAVISLWTPRWIDHRPMIALCTEGLNWVGDSGPLCAKSVRTVRLRGVFAMPAGEHQGQSPVRFCQGPVDMEGHPR
jgi:hypothetical protein